MKWLQKKLRCHGLEIYMKIHVASKKRVASKKSQCHIGKTYMQRHFPPILDSAVAKTSSAMVQKHICKAQSDHLSQNDTVLLLAHFLHYRLTLKQSHNDTLRHRLVVS